MNLVARMFIALSATLFLSQACFASSEKSWRFNVFLDGRLIGLHTFHLSQRPEQTYINIHADFSVEFLFITAYNYAHSNYEVWQGDCLSELQSTTNENGEELFVKARKLGTRFKIQSTNNMTEATGCIRSFAYWDSSFLKSRRLLNAQTGELMPVNTSYLGIEQISIRNSIVMAKHYELMTDEFTIDIWYSTKDEWLGLQSTTSNGAILRYEIQ